MDLDDSGPVRLAAGAAATEQDWDRAAAAVLRRAGRLAADKPDASAWNILARSTVEGVRIPPLGTPATVAGAHVLPEPSSTVAQRAESGWDIRSLIADPDSSRAAADAVTDLENGATSLWLRVGASGTAPADLERALQGVLLQLAPVTISASGAASDLEAATALARLFERNESPPDPRGCLSTDPVARAVRSGRPPGASIGMGDAVAELATLASAVGVRAITVDGTAAHEAGAGDVAELGYSLAVGVHCLRRLEAAGYDLAQALKLLEFRYAATADQFSTIAKFRAARVLWSRIGELSGETGPVGQSQHAVTSLPMLTRYDPWVNLLRTTVAAFAAGVGGADAVTVLPFDTRLGLPDPLGRRLARNISSLLISESHVAAVHDPAAGAQAVEMLTADLAEAGWAEFQRIEAAGGIVRALENGSVRERWAATVAERSRRIATRKQPITGVSEFPNLREVLPVRVSAPTTDQQQSVSWAAPFEQMRDSPAESPVFLATLGSVAEHGARAGFAANLFAAGGIDTVTAGRTAGVDDVITAFTAAGTTIACLAGTDTAYAASGVATATALRKAGATRVVLAGRPKGDLESAIDDHVAVGDDVVEFLDRMRRHLTDAESTR